MDNETYYYGQGKVYLALIDPTTGLPGASKWIGDVSGLTIKLTTQMVKHKESYSGQNSLVRSFPVGREGSLDMELFQIDSANLATALYGTASATTAGTATAETLANWVAAEDVLLANPGATNVVLTDSTPTTPKTLVEGTDYTVNGPYGRITPITVTGFTLPIKAAYSYSASAQTAIFTGGQPIAMIRYEGVNLAEQNAPVIAEYYKVGVTPLQELAHITSGTDVAGMKITADMLIDTTKPSSGPLGQFGRIINVGATS